MAEQKTKPTALQPDDFINAIANEQVRDDCYALSKLMSKVTGEPAVMWGTSIVGFGKYHYKYDSGHEGFSCLAGFSPRKANISLYVMPGAGEGNVLLKKLGKHKAGKGCLYINKLSDIDTRVLEQLVKTSVSSLKKKYPSAK